MTPDTASALVAKLGEKASPRPWQHHMEGSTRVCDGKHATTNGCETLVQAEILRRPLGEAEANAAYTNLAVNSFGLVLEALESAREARLATGRQSTCSQQVHGDSHIQCGRCFICLERKALATVREAAQEALKEA